MKKAFVLLSLLISFSAFTQSVDPSQGPKPTPTLGDRGGNAEDDLRALAGTLGDIVLDPAYMQNGVLEIDRQNHDQMMSLIALCRYIELKTLQNEMGQEQWKFYMLECRARTRE